MNNSISTLKFRMSEHTSILELLELLKSYPLVSKIVIVGKVDERTKDFCTALTCIGMNLELQHDDLDAPTTEITTSSILD